MQQARNLPKLCTPDYPDHAVESVNRISTFFPFETAGSISLTLITCSDLQDAFDS